MPELEIAIPRPQRWDEPFGDMTEQDVDVLLRVEPFRSIDASAFPPALPLRGILQGDTRVMRYKMGDLIVREGDYGHSAFLVLAGSVRVVLERLNPALLGRDLPPRRGWWQAVAQLWQNPRLPEVRRAVGPAGQFAASSESTRTQRGPSPQNDLHTSTRQQNDTTVVFLQDVPRLLERTGTVQLGVGEMFGELAALTRSPRTATVLADAPATLLEIRWQGLRDLMRRTPAIRAHVERLYRDNSLRVHLRETPLMARLPIDALERVAAATQFETYGNFDWYTDFKSYEHGHAADQIAKEPLIAAEGDRPTGVYLIRSGFARVSRRYGHGEQTLAYLGKGQVFGLDELAAAEATGEAAPWRHSLRAVGYVDVLRIPHEVVTSTILPHCPPHLLPATKATNAASPRLDHQQRSASDEDRPAINPRLLDFLADHRFLNGAHTMLIDMDRCTRCDDCVRACAATHDNNPRFVRQGPQHGRWMLAGACLHCVDPVCMIGCPTGAIARDTDTGTVRINDLTCIGCSTCANSCPYSAIRMVEIREPGGAILLDDASKQPILKATKCDFCTGQLTGPACQHACPHDALARIDMGNLPQLAAWITR